MTLQIAELAFLVVFSGLGFWIFGTERGASDALRLLDRICPSDSPSSETPRADASEAPKGGTQ